jgi:hypothetical protein
MARAEAIARAARLSRRVAAVLSSPTLTPEELVLARHYLAERDADFDQLEQAVTALERQLAKRAPAARGVAA